jgi:hypothetical protein
MTPLDPESVGLRPQSCDEQDQERKTTQLIQGHLVCRHG